MDFIFPWQCHGSYASHTREGEGGARAVLSGGGCSCFARVYARMFLVLCSRFGGKKHMGCLLREYRCPLATRFRAKKEVVWHDLRAKRCQLADFQRKRKVCGTTSAAKSADLRIFSEKGNGVARPLCHFSPLGEKGRWVAQLQQGKVPTRGFSAKKETVWRDLQKFFISLFTSTD